MAFVCVEARNYTFNSTRLLIKKVGDLHPTIMWFRHSENSLMHEVDGCVEYWGWYSSFKKCLQILGSL